MRDLVGQLGSYKKILVVGAPGAGKTYAAKIISVALDLPLYHLDHLFWQPNWVESDKRDFINRVATICTQDAFVIEGTYISSFKERVPYADVVVLVEVNFFIRLYRIISRTLKTRGKVRDDLGEGCVEKISWHYFKFLKWALKFKDTKQKIMAESCAANVPVIIYKNIYSHSN